MPAALTIDGRTLEVPAGESLFDAAARLGIRIPSSCRQQGTCKECTVEVLAGMDRLSERTGQEDHLRDPFRLACQCRVATDAGDVRGRTLRRGHMRIERNSPGLEHTLRSLIRDPAVTRDGDRVCMDGQEVARSAGPVHGIAIDLGTTTVVVRLINLDTGAFVADTSFENPQRFAGSNVMSRIQYATDHGAGVLRLTLAAAISRAIEEFPVDPSSIYEVVIAGNATMRDLFFGQDVTPIGQSPYRSVTETDKIEGRRTTTSLVSTGPACLLPIHPQARVYGMPVISGHVGADAAACLLAIDIGHEERLVALMDIGTNTEFILGNRHRILVASCPAGPAFEGGAMACGMPALDGAVESVSVDDEGAFSLGVIGGLAPEGICGSGLVDLLGELIRTGRITVMGRFRDPAGPIVLDAAGGIRLLERDVSELAQAKGATSAGLQVVFDTYGVEAGDVDVFYLAGAFGRHVRVEASQRIGLVPPVPAERVVRLGNAAIEGATIALLSRTKRAELETLVGRAEHCRLEAHPDFFHHFVEGCQFKPLEFRGREARAAGRPGDNGGTHR